MAETPKGPGTLASLLTAMQQGVIAINSLTQTLKTTFPSS